MRLWCNLEWKLLKKWTGQLSRPTAGFMFQKAEAGSSMVSTEEVLRTFNFHDFCQKLKAQHAEHQQN